MTLAQLAYIIAVDNYRNFSTAANHCFVTQPTLSMQIQKLEEELGILIFDRSKQPVIPTDIGKKLIRQARIITQEAEKLQSIIENETGEYAGTLKIGVIPTVAPYLVPIFLRQFMDKYPQVEIIIDELTTGEIVRGLTKDLIDVGILALPLHASDMVEKVLYYEPFVAYIPPTHKLIKKEKIKVNEIALEDLLLLKEGHCLREQTLKICNASRRDYEDNSNKIFFESGSLDMLKKLVEQGFGVTLLPYLQVKQIENPEQLKLLREFESPVPKREIGLMYNKATYKKHLIDSLAKEIKKLVPKELLSKENSMVIDVQL